MGLLSFLSGFFSSSQENEKPSELDNDDIFIQKNATILIVDDSKTQVAVCKKWLSEAGYETLTAVDGRDGIHQAKKGQPDLILMDIVMPEINGFQATRYLKKQADTRHIPIVMVSGEEQNSGKIWAKKLGACSFLVKPLQREILLRLISRVLNHVSTVKSI